MTINDAQKSVNEWIIELGGGYFDVLTNTAILMEEVGELARVVSRTDGMQKKKEGEVLNYGEELADILWVILCLANQKDVDLTQELHKSFVKKTKRDSKRFID
ncbi:MAG: nucleotide pyrophosphohydrolase [Chitinophagales bacterium]|jgi:NTP pyrophosphatase (non-canonical NTP hydrolase)|nr:nucleotide pyrophosphohydrolase [Sphingobacteriales bacterium]